MLFALDIFALKCYIIAMTLLLQRNLNNIHKEAMNKAEAAFILRIKEQSTEAKKLFEKAFQLEKKAADMLLIDFKLEPSRSILYRSAAYLAYNAGLYKEAEKMVVTGLAGNPPNEIAEELRNLAKEK